MILDEVLGVTEVIFRYLSVLENVIEVLEMVLWVDEEGVSHLRVSV